MTREPVKKRIIGIDPGYAITGYGIIDKVAGRCGLHGYRFRSFNMLYGLRRLAGVQHDTAVPVA